jgi:predicted PurR-regulated permease PerM
MPRETAPPAVATPKAGWDSKRIGFLTASAVLVCGLLLLVREVVLPFLLALIVAYLLTPSVAFLERRRVPPAAAILLVYALSALLLVGVASVIGPRLRQQGTELAREVPERARQALHSFAPGAERRINALLNHQTPEPSLEPRLPTLELQPTADGGYTLRLNAPIDVVRESADHFRIVVDHPTSSAFELSAWLEESLAATVEYVKNNAVELVRLSRAIVSATARGVVLTFMTLMCAAYIIYTRNDIVNFLRSLPPAAARPSFDRLLLRLDRGLAGVVRGQLLICVLNFVLSGIGFLLLGLKHWLLLAVVAGGMSIVPIFGSLLSSIPVVLIALAQDSWTALAVLVWIIIIHNLEAGLLNPQIIGVAAKLHPVLVVFALLVGEHYFGLWGAALAIPTLSLVRSLFNHFRHEYLPDAPPDSLVPRVRSNENGPP